MITDQKDIEVITDALIKAVEVIKSWHRADNVWNIYCDHSPEMQPIMKALKIIKNDKSAVNEKTTL